MLFERERGREGKQKKRNIDVKDKHWLVAFHTCSDGVAKCATKACAMTGNQTRNLSVCATMPNQLNHTGQGLSCLFFSRILLAISRAYTSTFISLSFYIHIVKTWVHTLWFKCNTIVFLLVFLFVSSFLKSESCYLYCLLYTSDAADDRYKV